MVPLVDEVVELDVRYREALTEANELRASRNALSKKVGQLMGQAKKDPSKLAEAEEAKAQVKANADRLAELEKATGEMGERIKTIMMTIPNMIDPSVPIGPDDSHNVEVQRFGEPKTPDFEIPYHTEIMERFDGIDLDAARRVSGNGFYYLMGDIARLHEAVLAYARDFMIDEKHFTYVIPPFMMHGSVVKGVMSFPELLRLPVIEREKSRFFTEAEKNTLSQAALQKAELSFQNADRLLKKRLSGIPLSDFETVRRIADSL